MSSMVFRLGPPKDGETPDTVIVALATVDQALELAARIEKEAERMSAESETGQIAMKGRFRK